MQITMVASKCLHACIVMSYRGCNLAGHTSLHITFIHLLATWIHDLCFMVCRWTKNHKN